MKILSLCLLILSGSCLMAQNPDSLSADTTKKILPKVWNRGGGVTINLSQVSLSNWAAGGSGSTSGIVLFNLFLNRKKERTIWENRVDMAYGLIKQGENNDFRKSDDVLILSSKHNYEMLGNKLYYTNLAELRTQFTVGYKYEKDPLTDLETATLISDFLSPGFLILSTGLSYKPNDSFSITVSPLTGKITIVQNDALSAAGAYGIDPGETIRKELGSNITAEVKTKIMENVQLKSNLNLFSGYGSFGNVDLNSETVILMKVNKYISASITTQFIYDDDIDIIRDNGTAGPSLQVKNVINVGFVYSFVRK
jgi:hypothetical protein